MATSHLDRTSFAAGATAEHAAELKMAKYADLLQYYDFVAVAVETFGAWSTSALDFIKSLGRRITEVTGEKLETAYLLQRLSVTIQRCNAVCFAGSFKSDSN